MPGACVLESDCVACLTGVARVNPRRCRALWTGAGAVGVFPLAGPVRGGKTRRMGVEGPRGDDDGRDDDGRDAGVDEEAVPVDTGRVLAMSDGVFAIAATLLALDLRVPEGLSTTALYDALRELVPSLDGYVISYLVIGLLWISHHQLFRSLHHLTHGVAALNIVLLGFVATLPFPSSMLAGYGDVPVVVIIYACNVGAIAVMQVAIALLSVRTRGIHEHRVRLMVGLPAGVAVVFLLSAPLALASTLAATTSWTLVILWHLVMTRRARRSKRT